MRAEIDALRERVVGKDAKAQADYWTDIADRVEKDLERMVAAFTGKKS